MSCPLCVAEHLTTWLYEGEFCYVCLCKTCNVPMVVLRQHNVKPPSEELDRMLKVLNEAALRHFGHQCYWIDNRRRRIPDHYHLHARQIEDESADDWKLAGKYLRGKSPLVLSSKKGERQL